jgi:large subunit ribosomal protein L21
MFAVIKTGGKQYKVAKDDVIRVEKLDGDAGASVELRDVMMVGNGADVTVGSPIVEGAVVTAEVVEQTRGAKIIVFKKKRRKDYQRTRGHRQELTVLRVTDISPDGKKAAAKTKAAPKAKKADAAPEEDAKAKSDSKPAAKKTAEKKPATKKAAAKKPAAKKPAAKKSEDNE